MYKTQCIIHIDSQHKKLNYEISNKGKQSVFIAQKYLLNELDSDSLILQPYYYNSWRNYNKFGAPKMIKLEKDSTSIGEVKFSKLSSDKYYIRIFFRDAKSYFIEKKNYIYGEKDFIKFQKKYSRTFETEIK